MSLPMKLDIITSGLDTRSQKTCRQHQHVEPQIIRTDAQLETNVEEESEQCTMG